MPPALSPPSTQVRGGRWWAGIPAACSLLCACGSLPPHTAAVQHGALDLRLTSCFLPTLSFHPAELHLEGDFKKTKLKLTWLAQSEECPQLELQVRQRLGQTLLPAAVVIILLVAAAMFKPTRPPARYLATSSLASCLPTAHPPCTLRSCPALRCLALPCAALRCAALPCSTLATL